MSTEIDTLSAGEIQPFNQGLQERPFAPELDNSWGRTDLDEYRPAPSSGPTLFGAPLPPGTTQQQADVVLGQLGAAFMNDFAQLGYPATYVQAAIQFMTANATKAPYHVTPRHNLRLPKEADDYLGHAFANTISELSGSPRAKQQFVTATITWLAKITAKLNSQTAGSVTMPRTAPNSSQAALSQLSDAEYARVIKINEQAQLQTLNTLAAKHGQYTAQNMIALANAQLQKLTPQEAAHFDQFTSGWVAMTNTVEAVEFLYNAAVGANSIPKDGAGVASELIMFEAMLKNPTERAKYMKDPELQARYRALLTMQQGG